MPNTPPPRLLPQLRVLLAVKILSHMCYHHLFVRGKCGNGEVGNLCLFVEPTHLDDTVVEGVPGGKGEEMRQGEKRWGDEIQSTRSIRITRICSLSLCLFSVSVSVSVFLSVSPPPTLLRGSVHWHRAAPLPPTLLPWYDGTVWNVRVERLRLFVGHGTTLI